MRCSKELFCVKYLPTFALEIKTKGLNGRAPAQHGKALGSIPSIHKKCSKQNINSF
jgi:hypothetical protein